ncbi:MAG TPA: hypothetical protein VF599_24505 [Pyrinomonadaceae bacterium]|jgi:hypothetical protein
MKKTTLTEDASRTVFDERDFAPNQIAVNRESALQDNPSPENVSFLDGLLIAVKWLLLYLPGVAAIHFDIIGWALASFYAGSFVELLTGTIGIYAGGTFMIMFGIGKLIDLKYLRVVAAIFLISILEAILYWTIAVFYKIDYFGFFLLVTWLFTAFVGYLVKINTDRAEAKN